MLQEDPINFSDSTYRLISRDISLIELISSQLDKISQRKLSIIEFSAEESDKGELIEKAWKRLFERALIEDNLNEIIPKMKSILPNNLFTKVVGSSKLKDESV